MGVTSRRLAGLGNFLKDHIPAALGTNLANIALKGLRDGGEWDIVGGHEKTARRLFYAAVTISD